MYICNAICKEIPGLNISHNMDTDLMHKSLNITDNYANTVISFILNKSQMTTKHHTLQRSYSSPLLEYA